MARSEHMPHTRDPVLRWQLWGRDEYMPHLIMRRKGAGTPVQDPVELLVQYRPCTSLQYDSTCSYRPIEWFRHFEYTPYACCSYRCSYLCRHAP